MVRRSGSRRAGLGNGLGWTLVVTAWTPDGFTGQVTALMGEYLPAPLAVARKQRA
jgi:hypothetical protein